eukprot:COSAG02_NODE_12904_length_1474_cov_1.425455_3_plen_104_part_00
MGGLKTERARTSRPAERTLTQVDGKSLPVEDSSPRAQETSWRTATMGDDVQTTYTNPLDTIDVSKQDITDTIDIDFVRLSKPRAPHSLFSLYIAVTRFWLMRL